VFPITKSQKSESGFGMGRLRRCDLGAGASPRWRGNSCHHGTVELKLSSSRALLVRDYARLGAGPGFLRDTNGNCGRREGARERLEPLFVHCNVIVAVFGLLVWLEPHR